MRAAPILMPSCASGNRNARWVRKWCYAASRVPLNRTSPRTRHWYENDVTPFRGCLRTALIPTLVIPAQAGIHARISRDNTSIEKSATVYPVPI